MMAGGSGNQAVRDAHHRHYKRSLSRTRAWRRCERCAHECETLAPCDACGRVACEHCRRTSRDGRRGLVVRWDGRVLLGRARKWLCVDCVAGSEISKARLDAPEERTET